MGNVFLISGDPTTQEEITTFLPKGVALEVFSTPEQLPRPAGAPGEGAYADKLILVDLATTRIPAARLDPFRLAGIPLLALIGSPEEREPALLAGFDDYALRPLSGAELHHRLERWLGKEEAAEAVAERERRAAVGRLTSYFCHAVNNSIQTIRGAVDLALEEPGLAGEVAEYLTICRKETVALGAKINRLRTIYRPDPSPPEKVELMTLLRDALNMAADDLIRNNITVKEKAGEPPPAVFGSVDRLTLAFLMMVFFLSEELGRRGGGDLRVETGRERRFAQANLCAAFGSGPSEEEGPEGVLPAGLEPASRLIKAEQGGLLAVRRESELCLEVRFPAGGS